MEINKWVDLTLSSGLKIKVFVEGNNLMLDSEFIRLALKKLNDEFK